MQYSNNGNNKLKSNNYGSNRMEIYDDDFEQGE